MPRDQVFISYSHKDKKWLDDLIVHLKPYLRDGSLTAWSDQQIAPGSNCYAEIHTALLNTRVAVLLVSPDFLASDFIHERELGPLLKEAQDGGVKVLWVAVRGSAYMQTPLKDYQAALDPAKPLAELQKAKRDSAWVIICQEIQNAMREPRASGNSIPRRQSGSGGQHTPLAWDDHLGHTYRSEGIEIITEAVQISATNRSGRSVRLENARVCSAITGGIGQVLVAVTGNWIHPGAGVSIPVNGVVTFKILFGDPSGLRAQEFINSWGVMDLSVAYDGTTENVPITEQMTRALYANFRPSPIEPQPTRTGTGLGSSVRRPETTSSSENDRGAGSPRPLKTRYFVVGCLLLAVALGLTIWGFSLRTLTEDQRRLLTFSLPLAAGFSAGAFAGSISARARHWIPGILITSTGGFSIWLITFFFLFRENTVTKEAPVSPTPTPTVGQTPSPTPTPPAVTAPVRQPTVAPSQPTELEPSDFVGTWQCIDPNTQKLLKTVKFDTNFTYKEWRGNQIIQGNYKYNTQTKELSFVYVQESRGNEDIMEIGRVTPINHTAFQFKVLAGYTPTLPPGSIYEFRR